MALDGAFLHGIVHELKYYLVGGRIYKIYQPETDEICFVIKNRVDDENVTKRLIISADASLPLIYMRGETKENPATAPNFCMLLRKHIGNGRITDIMQIGLERVIRIDIEHLDELGDVCKKKIYVEIMGKHSNIIFTDYEDAIIDSIKRISYQISSVREVLPGRKYELPPSKDKANPLLQDVNFFMNHAFTKPENVCKAIYTTYEGISPVLANEVAYRANVDASSPVSACTMAEREEIYRCFAEVMDEIKNGHFEACIAYNGYEPKEFCIVKLSSYGEFVEDKDMPDKDVNGLKAFASPSELIEEYYSAKSDSGHIKQHSADLRHIVSNAVERTAKKYDLQLKQLKDTEKKDKYRVYGELITAYGYTAKPGDKELVCENYYTGKEISIPLDPTITCLKQGEKYFDKYNKLKRTAEALEVQTKTSKEELDYLLSVQNSLEIANSLNDLIQIKQELIDSGYIRGKSSNGKNKKMAKSKPLHYISSDGYHMYVGKNNYQNDELTFDFANGGDMWFHAKHMAGSHVIVKTDGKELPDSTYEEAARLAAYYSSGKDAPKVEIDYTVRKNLKKPPKAKPGYVIYHTNYSMTTYPDIHGITEIKDK